METILGIDLGTTNSEVAVYRDGRPVVLGEPGELMLPSVVGLDPSGKLLVGRAARNQWALAPERTVRSIKRRMGEDSKIALGGQEYSPQEISAMILRTLKQRAETALGRPVSKAVVTVPAYFNETQRQATAEAGHLAGLEVVRILNEPTAASLAYTPQSEKIERLLVYDLGGGTFDVSIVQMEQGVVEVLASHGDTRLGGDDFDELLLNHVCDRFKQEHAIDLYASPVARSRLLHAVEEAKRTLSFEPTAQVQETFLAEKDGVPLHLDYELTRVAYEALIEPLLAKTLACVDQALADSRLSAPLIDKVVLVGGSTRTPLVHKILEDRLRQPVHLEVEPDLCVAMGAAMQAAMIAGDDVGPVLVDVTAHTLGVECLATLHGQPVPYQFAPVIPRNTPLPASRSEMFDTWQDDQIKVVIPIRQGESNDARRNQKIGQVTVEGLAKRPAGNEILVRFDLDAGGMLRVTATERVTGLAVQSSIDNPIGRFRANDVDAARERLAAAFGDMAVVEVEDVSSEVQEVSTVPPELRDALERASRLLTAAGAALEHAQAEDRDELDRLVGRLSTAVRDLSPADIESASSQIEDLLFYLQDA